MSNAIKKFTQKIYTHNAVSNIMKKIKENKQTAYKIGEEMTWIYKIMQIYIENNGHFDYDNVYDLISESFNFENMIIRPFLIESLDYELFFPKLNTKIMLLKFTENKWSFFRGYYLNDLNMMTYNLTDLNMYRFNLYDFHSHYLNYIYKLIVDIKNTYNIKLLKCEHAELNNYIHYNLAFTHKKDEFNDSILKILKLLYHDVNDNNDLYSVDDLKLYNAYLEYNNNY